MTARIAADVPGARVLIAVPPEFGDAVRAALVDLVSADPELDRAPRDLTLERRADGALTLAEDGVTVLEDIADASAVEAVLWRLNWITGESPDHVVLHAGCATDGHAAVLPGPSGVGKSTLTAHCVRAGLGYLSDEHAAIGLESGEIVPYAKAINIKGQGLVPASTLRADAVGARTRGTAVVFPRYERETRLTVEPVTAADTLVALCANITNAVAAGSAGFLRLAELAARSTSVVVRFGDARDAVSVVRDSLLVAGEGTTEPEDLWTQDGPVSTSVLLGTEIVVRNNIDASVHKLNESATAVWLSLGDHLAPEDVRATIDRLSGLGLLPR